MKLASRPRLFVVAVVGSVVALVVACGSSDDSKFDDGQPPAGFNVDGAFGDADFPDVDLYKNDPPPKYCGPDPQKAPPPIGGSESCPDDKNLPGCGCLHAGEKAKCWQGFRANRNIGICKDGETTCIQKSENTLVWGPCSGQVLPKPGGKGQDACACFSAGQWKIANLSPCTTKLDNNGTITYTGVSTVVGQDGVARCPDGNPPPQPTADWSTDTLKVDCAGHYKLCLRVRNGVFETPNPTSDCLLAEVCTESDYIEPNVEQAWPNLKSWASADKACVDKWWNTPENVSPGYAEMVVKGISTRCEPVDDGSGNEFIFNRVKYCPKICRDPANAQLPECVTCQQSGKGEF